VSLGYLPAITLPVRTCPDNFPPRSLTLSSMLVGMTFGIFGLPQQLLLAHFLILARFAVIVCGLAQVSH
jgi:hypothetical protein